MTMWGADLVHPALGGMRPHADALDLIGRCVLEFLEVDLSAPRLIRVGVVVADGGPTERADLLLAEVAS